MTPVLLIIRQNGKESGRFHSSPSCPTEQLRQLARHLQTLPGCVLELQRSCGERRILDSGPTGLRLLSAEILYEPADLQAWLQEGQETVVAV
ncbi:hypothetical protein [Alcaligenes sp. SDU_A2]|uniref:hypothetical protein n=1 Tax=Alcaligenes sp. SDU_A2 TaxID=3136634 RepID=UPI002BEA8FAE|nr:hypothetical protein [Alcaligenes sp.]HRL27361.1 hypothetical protein [Alcaligenes sp.]